jgi:hypothetical protein
MRVLSSGVFTLIAAWQAMEAAIRLFQATRLFQNFDQHAFELRAFETGGRGFDGDGARSKKLYFKPVRFEFPADSGEGDHLRRQKVD